MEQPLDTNGDAATSNAENEVLDPSELGTKEYWDCLYTRELQNHNDDPDDEGTIWFEESNAEFVVRKQLDKLRQDGFLRPRRLDDEVDQYDQDEASPPSRFLDIGTGNGHMLFFLLGVDNEDDNDDEQFDNDEHPSPWRYNEMVGIDYSATSIQLTRQIASRHGFSTQTPTSQLRFEQHDLLNDHPDPSWLQDGFNVALDKGTFDAISLMPQTSSTGPHQHPCETYRSKVTPLIKPRGFLILTSCNWTRDELVRWLTSAEDGDDGLKFFDEAAYPTFTFGGRKGQSVVTVVFRRSVKL